MSYLEGHRYTYTVMVGCVRFVRILVLVLLSGLMCGVVRQMVRMHMMMRKTGSWKVLYILASPRSRMDRLVVLTEHCI